MIKRLIRAVTPKPVWALLRVWAIRRSLARYHVRQVTHQYGDVQLRVELSDPLAEGWYDHDWTPLPELTLLAKGRLKGGARVFDLGAHQGIVALQLAHAVGETGSVIALEANPHNARAAKRNCELNGGVNVEIIHAAIAEKRGTLIFNKGLNGAVDDGSGEWGKVEVDAWSIDDLATRYGSPDVIFLDVEGYEARALSGAQLTLARRPDCFVEVHVGPHHKRFGSSLDEVMGYFPESHYTLFMHTDQGGVVTEPVPFDRGSNLVRARFFLTAIAKSG